MSNMTTILVQGLAGLMLLFFGAMALYPLFFADKPANRAVDQDAEDRVLHISPVPMIERIRPVPGSSQPRPLGDRMPVETPHRRDAA